MINIQIYIPTLLGAAAKVIERVQATKDPVEQERLLNSVINKLSENTEYDRSTALAHAYALRARARADQGKWDLSIDDVKIMLLGNHLRYAATDSRVSMAYRVWVDAEKQLYSGTEKVVSVLQRWQIAQPFHRTKLQREIQELLLNHENEMT